MFSFLLYHKEWLYVQNYVELPKTGEILMLGGEVWDCKHLRTISHVERCDWRLRCRTGAASTYRLGQGVLDSVPQETIEGQTAQRVGHVHQERTSTDVQSGPGL